jgi:hypothetical protein
MACDATPDCTDAPLTVIAAFSDSAVGVTVTELTSKATSAEYEVVAVLNTGASVPAERVRLVRLALLSAPFFPPPHPARTIAKSPAAATANPNRQRYPALIILPFSK